MIFQTRFNLLYSCAKGMIIMVDIGMFTTEYPLWEDNNN